MTELTGFPLAAYLCLTLVMERVILELKLIEGGNRTMLQAKHKILSEMSRMGIVERVPLQRCTPGRPGVWYQLTGLGKDLAKYLEERRIHEIPAAASREAGNESSGRELGA